MNGAITAQNVQGLNLPLKVTYQGRQALLTFEQPLPAKSQVVIILDGIKNVLPVTQSLSFPLAAREIGQLELRQFGTAQITVRLP